MIEVINVFEIVFRDKPFPGIFDVIGHFWTWPNTDDVINFNKIEYDVIRMIAEYLRCVVRTLLRIEDRFTVFRRSVSKIFFHLFSRTFYDSPFKENNLKTIFCRWTFFDRSIWYFRTVLEHSYRLEQSDRSFLSRISRAHHKMISHRKKSNS